VLLALQLFLAFALGGLGGFLLGRRPWRRTATVEVHSHWNLPPDHAARGPLCFLEGQDPRKVAAVLATESPVDAAGVLGLLNPGYADMVLQLMPEARQIAAIEMLQIMPQLVADEQEAMAAHLRQRLNIVDVEEIA
jgi:hypothetical protein